MKKLSTALGILALTALAPSAANAEICYKLNPFVDVIRVTVLASPELATFKHYLMYGNWIATGSYTIPVSGARELNVGSSTARHVGLTGTNPTAFFGSNLLCGVDGVPGGAWQLQCSGAAGNFTNQGTPFAVVSCAASPKSAPAGKAAGSSK